MKLSIDKLLQVAMELKEAGEVCYEVISTVIGRSSEPLTAFLSQCAGDERRHYETFRRMLNENCDKTKRSPQRLTPDERAYIKTLLPSESIPDIFAMRAQAGTMTVSDAMAMAAKGKRDAIAFYTGMLLAVDDKDDAATIRKIIDEEKTHEQELLARFAKFSNMRGQ